MISLNIISATGMFVTIVFYVQDLSTHFILMKIYLVELFITLTIEK